MSQIADPAYLRGEQYKTADNLNARVALHRRFSTNRQGWLRWAFEQLDLRPGQRVLEVGGGPGWLWRENQERRPAGLTVIVSDFSPGMAQTACAHLPEDSFRCAILDAQALPFPAASFDLVIANHMLYHVPDLPGAARELARVLKPAGRLAAGTNGRAHLRELHELMHAYDPGYVLPADGVAERFALENAPAVLGAAFARVEVRPYEDALWITEARPLVEYILSYTGFQTGLSALTPARAADLEAFVQARLAAQGGLRIGKATGLVLAGQE